MKFEIPHFLFFGKKNEATTTQPIPTPNPEPVQVQKTKSTPEELAADAESFNKASKPILETDKENSPIDALLEGREQLLKDFKMVDQDKAAALKEVEDQIKELDPNALKEAGAENLPQAKTMEEFLGSELLGKIDKKLLEILSGAFFVSHEIAKKTLEKNKTAQDLEQLIGKGNIEFDANGNISKFDIQAIKNKEEMEAKKTVWERVRDGIKDLGKNPRFVIKVGLGAIGVGAGIAIAPTALVGISTAVFAGGMAGLCRAGVEFVRSLNLKTEESEKYLRLNAEKADWEKYQEMLEVSKEVKGGKFEQVSQLVEMVKNFEQESFAKHDQWKKEKLRWDIMDISAGIIGGGAAATYKLLSGEDKIVAEMMKKGVPMDLDSDGVPRIVKKIGKQFYFLYRSMADPQVLADKFHTKVTMEFANKSINISPELGAHGGHILNYSEAIKNAFNKEFILTCAKGIGTGMGVAALEFARLIGVRKNPASKDYKEWEELTQGLTEALEEKAKEENVTKEKEKLEELAKEEKEKNELYKLAQKDEYYILKFDGKTEAFRVKRKFTDADGQELIEFEDDFGSGIAENKKEEKLHIFEYDRQYFNQVAGKEYKYPNLLDNEKEIYDEHKEVIDKLKSIGKNTEIVFINEDEAIKDLKIEKPIGKYVLWQIDTEKNYITLSDTGKARDVQNRRIKLTDLVRHIAMPEKKFEWGETKKEKSKEEEPTKENTSQKATEQAAEPTTEPKYKVGDKIKFSSKNKKGDIEDLEGVIEEFKDGKYKVKVTKDDGSEFFKSPPEQYIKEKIS